MIIGVDEVNFSPSLAGDCVVVALARRLGARKVRGVRDSKQLTHKQRLALFERLQEASYYAVVPATVNDINQEGIYKARNYAIDSAIDKLCRKLLRVYDAWKGWPDNVLEKIVIDGHFSNKWLNYFSCGDPGRPTIECLVNGDEKVYEISAASIVARVYADALFSGFGEFYPGYDLEKCHGSPSEKMYEKIREFGPTPYHRTNYGLNWWKKIMAGKRKKK